MPPQHMPAPKRPQLRKGMVGMTLPPQALTLVDSLVGTFVGSSRSEVVRFIVASWLMEHAAAVTLTAGKYKDECDAAKEQ